MLSQPGLTTPNINTHTHRADNVYQLGLTVISNREAWASRSCLIAIILAAGTHIQAMILVVKVLIKIWGCDSIQYVGGGSW